jgi:hypothetical protein
MQPGLTRAIPMGILGFILGAAFVLVLRSLQSMDPLWDAQVGVLMAGLGATIGFVWGMGGFSREQAHHHIEAHYDDNAGEIVVVGAHAEHGDGDAHADPRQSFGFEVWQIVGAVVVIFAVLLAFTSIASSPSVTISNDPAANTNTIGYFEMNLFGRDVAVSQLFALLLFVAFMLLSLAAIGWVISLAFFGMSRGLTIANAEGNIPLNALPSGAVAVAGALPSGEDEIITRGEPVGAYIRTVGERAWAIVVPNLIAFAVLLAPVDITLSILGLTLGDNPAISMVISALLTGLLTLLIMRILPRPAPRRAGAPSLFGLLFAAVIIFVALVVVFSVIVNAATQVMNVLYVPMEPSRTIVPFYSALFLTPFVMDVIYSGQALSLGQKIRKVLVPAVFFEVLYLIFYGAAIGLILPQDPIRTLVTAINSAVITLVLMYAGEVLWCIGKVAQFILWILRGVPTFLGQK